MMAVELRRGRFWKMSTVNKVIWLAVLVSINVNLWIGVADHGHYEYFVSYQFQNIPERDVTGFGSRVFQLTKEIKGPEEVRELQEFIADDMIGHYSIVILNWQFMGRVSRTYTFFKPLY